MIAQTSAQANCACKAWVAGTSQPLLDEAEASASYFIVKHVLPAGFLDIGFGALQISPRGTHCACISYLPAPDSESDPDDESGSAQKDEAVSQIQTTDQIHTPRQFHPADQVQAAVQVRTVTLS